MSSKPVLLIDIDDVILDTRPVIEKAINADLASFGLTDTVVLDPNIDWENPASWGVPEKNKEIAFAKLIEIFAKATNQPFEMIEGADNAIKILKNKYKIILLTSRPQYFAKNTTKQLNATLGEKIMKDIEIYHNGVDGMTKADYAASLKNVWGLIDNQSRHVNGLLKKGLNGIVFGAQGIPNWDDVLKKLL